MFSFRGMVYGVDCIHLVGVGVGIKKPTGVIVSGNKHFCNYLSHSEGSRTMAQGLREMRGREGMNDIFRVGGWCEELTEYIRLG